ncbi:hypothetical protein DEU56DRAFT_981950 [Suillus clintonianus]|uniref:uncharacterized protein n=1 Tax=Suillus clintonianus TaxID=1904413 RepID=UPI001B8826E5|nr:uncharacterized protein DEU56DRAFT_981950 [Suillus clintonianus]KAG2131387.1 hypothetical protein DEU56DRAFT_981950 [Suillus clintonianus]
MSRPRYSVLNLFDPLNAAPRSEATTPDSLSGSDKENAEPSCESYYESDRLTMTAFFNRTYKTQSKHYSPVVLRTRLVDVGDMTIMDETADLFNGLTIEEEPEDFDDNASLVHESMEIDEQDSLATPMNSPPRQSHNFFNAAQTPLSEQTPTPHGQRTPLADISFDATPVPRKVVTLAPATFEAPVSGVEHYSSPATAVRASHATLAPVGSPLASVINAINFTDQNVPSMKPIPEHATPTIVLSREENLGSSTAQLSPSPSTALLTHTHLSESPPVSLSPPLKYHNQSSPSRDILAAPAARPRLRPRAHTTSSPSLRRNSVDLHSSFNLQLQCPDASFDLLNDRISFFGGDAFTIDGDDFDMQAEEEMMEALAKRIKEKDAVTKFADVAASPALQSGPSPTPQPSPPVVSANAPPAAMRSSTRRSSLSPGMKLSSPSPRPPMVGTPKDGVFESLKLSIPLSPVASPALPSVTPPRISQTFVAPVPAAPVHALRIVKRPKAHDKTTSVSSAGSSSTGSSEEEQLAPAVPPALIHKPVLTGVRRPPPGHMPADLKSNMFCKPEEGVRPVLGVRGKLTSVLGLRTKATEPPRSPLETCMPSQPAQTIKPPSGTLKSRLLKPTASSLSKAPPLKIPTASNPTAESKSLRPPSRFATVGMASGLPRPTGGALPSSRLPAPTFSAPKSKLPSMTGSSSTIGRSATIRRV